MAPTPFSEYSFRDNLLTSLIPIQSKSSTTSNSDLCRNLVNGSTRTDVQNIFQNSILQAKKDFEDFAEFHRNSFTNNFKNQLKNLEINTNKALVDSVFTKPSNDFHIIRKGPFFQDPFFEKCRQQFEKSVKDIVSKSDLRSSLKSDSSSNSLISDVNNTFFNDDFKSYRNLRDTQLREENQAASLVQEDHQHKIVIDVKDFMGGDIKVNSFNNTIRIEGHHDVSSQSLQKSSSSKRNFCKEFTLPGVVDMEVVKSTMSSDGILTITVPRLQTESTARVSFPTNSNVTQSQSTSQMAQSPLNMTNPQSQITHQPSHRERHLNIQELPNDGQTQANGATFQNYATDQLAHSPSYMNLPHFQNVHQPSQSDRNVNIQELPNDGQTDVNSATSRNYVTYPEEVEGATCHSYSRKPHGGYWKR